MNFTFTLKTTVIFLIALVLAGIVGAIAGRYYGLALMLIVVMYLANQEKSTGG